MYGAFAAAPFFLIWMYVVWLMALGGAVFARTLSLPATAEETRGPRQPLLLQCARVLAILRTAHERGEAVAPAELEGAVGLTQADRERIFQALAEERLVRRTADGRLALGRSLETVTLLDLHRRLPEALDAARLPADDATVNVARRLQAMAAHGERELNVSLDAVLGEGASAR